MIAVEQALAHLFTLVGSLGTEQVPLAQASGRTLARDVGANRDQPPFAAAAMDGYALRSADTRPGAVLTVIGEAAAGHGFAGTVDPGQAVRIFTGAPMPRGADRVIMQEDVTRADTGITLGAAPDEKDHVRPAGGDFRAGQTPLAAPRRLAAADIALLAAMNVAVVPVIRRPVVALISTGDELVMPGEAPGPDQIIASNGFGLKALLEAAGAHVRLLPIARDTAASLETAFGLANGADMVVTIGGASVGDHDLVGPVAQRLGLERQFYKVAMRPGKPLMAGRMGDAAMVGLPGNPVSAMVCGHVFLLPMLRAMSGLGAAPAPCRRAPLAAPLPANGPRAHYMRAEVTGTGLRVFDNQDSSLLTLLARAQALLIRPVQDPPRATGDIVDYLAL